MDIGTWIIFGGVWSVLQLGPAESAATKPCFTQVVTNIPAAPLAMRWKNSGGCTCKEAVARSPSKTTIYM